MREKRIFRLYKRQNGEVERALKMLNFGSKLSIQNISLEKLRLKKLKLTGQKEE